MAYNVCVNCGTNLNHMLGVYEIDMEIFKQELEKASLDDKLVLYFNNLFFLKHNIDRICCRAFFLSFIDYVPSNM